MKRSDDSRFFRMAEAYDAMCRTLVPCYDFLQDQVLDFSQVSTRQSPVVVDLGAGSGIFLEKVKERNPGAVCYWIDYSADFLRIAQQRLARFSDVRYISRPLEEHWETDVAEPPDFVFSMSAIHHLTTEEKKAVYSQVYARLKPSGWFFNIDEMKGITEGGYLNSLRFWVEHVKEATRRAATPEQRAGYAAWNAPFDRWKVRNVDNWDQPKTKGDDLHESAVDQARWLDEIGFKDADILLKYHLWSVIAGRKPG